MTNPFNAKCSTCRHFDGEDEEAMAQGNGQCRAKSPTTVLLLVPSRHPISGQTQMVPQQFSLFPQVSAEECYCSEWARGLVIGGDQ